MSSIDQHQNSPRPPPTGAAGLFSVDAEDRDTYHRVWHQARMLSPHQRLAAAVLIQAIDDATLPRRGRYHREARRWLFQDRTRSALCPFELACEWLGFSPAWIRQQVRQRIRQQARQHQQAVSWGLGHE